MELAPASVEQRSGYCRTADMKKWVPQTPTGAVLQHHRCLKWVKITEPRRAIDGELAPEPDLVLFR
jgi:hypothetical protein